MLWSIDTCQKRYPLTIIAWQYRGLGFIAHRGQVFVSWPLTKYLFLTESRTHIRIKARLFEGRLTLCLRLRLCLSFVSTILMGCKTLSPSISQGLIHLSCRSEDELVLSLDKRPRKCFATILRNKDEFNRLNQTINSRFRNKDRFSQRIVAVGRLDGLVQLTCDRDTFAHVSSTVLHMRTLCVAANLSTRVQWIADLWP